jgi:hypothetical protein
MAGMLVMIRHLGDSKWPLRTNVAEYPATDGAYHSSNEKSGGRVERISETAVSADL